MLRLRGEWSTQRRGADRQTDSECANLSFGPATAAGAGGSDWRDLHWWRGIGAWISEPAGVDGGEIYAESVCDRAGSAAVSDRRPWAASSGRRVGVCGSPGPSGEDPRLSHRAG